MEGCVVVQESTDIPEKDTSGNDAVLQNFIETYEAHPELWNSSHPCYMNKAKRNSALDSLANIYSKIKPGANRDDVKRKINTLRSNYRKELKKIAASESGEEEVYRPTSWVFYALEFLNNCGQPFYVTVELTETAHDDGSRTYVSSQADSTVIGKEPGKQSPAPLPSTPARSPIIPTPPPPKKQRVVGSLSPQNGLLSLACKYFEKSKKLPDNEPIITKVWGEKLLALDQQQRLFAEKAINDVLFEASLGSLHRHSVRINEDPHDRRNTSVQSFTLTSGDISAPLADTSIASSTSLAEEITSTMPLTSFKSFSHLHVSKWPDVI